MSHEDDRIKRTIISIAEKSGETAYVLGLRHGRLSAWEAFEEHLRWVREATFWGLLVTGVFGVFIGYACAMISLLD